MSNLVSGEFVSLEGSDFYRIGRYDQLPPFFMTVVSSSDHWLFVSSTGGLTAGRADAEHALFPYETVDRIHESTPHSGPITVFRVHGPQRGARATRLWQPLDLASLETGLERNLYKQVLGTSLVFEETHVELGLRYRVSLATSDRYGLVRRCTVSNVGDSLVELEVIDGVRNVLPHGVSLALQQEMSSLVDAYRSSEVDAGLGLATFALSSAITDRAEPLESLRCSAFWSRGLPGASYTLDPAHVTAFRRGTPFAPAHELKGKKGALLATSRFTLKPGESQTWVFVGDVGLGQAEVVKLGEELRANPAVLDDLAAHVARGHRALASIIGASDGFQVGGDRKSTAHHAANVLFNDMRGGVFAQGYTIDRDDFIAFVGERNQLVHARQRAKLDALPAAPRLQDLLEACQSSGDVDLQRLGFEYLPLIFSRRHGDPSRPWNKFNIRLRGPRGERLINYEGNWRDIFQNWEALCFSYPAFLPSVIAKFVNASTLDGHNPYRVTRAGVDWEVPEPHVAWANIGYWGDHQVVYLLRLLEHCERFFPGRLQDLLTDACFSYADVPYRIKPYQDLVADPRHTIDFDHDRHGRVLARCKRLGGDGRLVPDGDGVLHVNLAEKLAVTMLAKLSNLVVDGGIWLNTQRPEWNDANNALVGYAASMVTLYHLRRFQMYFARLLEPLRGKTVRFSREVADWLHAVSAVYVDEADRVLGPTSADDVTRKRVLDRLGAAFSAYRSEVYEHGVSGTVEVSVDRLGAFLELSVRYIDHSIHAARRDNGLYDAYKLVSFSADGVGERRLYDMLEGQVSALSSGQLEGETAARLLETMQTSALHRADQHSYLLYPVRELESYLDRNRIDAGAVEKVPLFKALVHAGDSSLVIRDAAGSYRFNASLRNARDVAGVLDQLGASAAFGGLVGQDRARVLEAYEAVFRHAEFTGRSGRMYGYEGIGCIYWHMVAKLLLAAQEQALDARRRGDASAGALADAYDRVRAGLCFNKDPEEYGAFPMDPYSHTPPFAGAQQPGMTGQVKEIVLTRFGELGVRVEGGVLSFSPTLLHARELLTAPASFEYLALDGQLRTLTLGAGELGFTYCQVPVVYRAGAQPGLVVWQGDQKQVLGGVSALPAELSAAIFGRTGRVTRVDVTVRASDLR
jgi:hypothetical protein